MIGCDNIITVIHHIKTDNDEYICTPYNNASWFEKVTISTSADGAKPVNSYVVRIMGDIYVEVEVGDYVALGTVSGIQKPADLKNINHFRVTAVGDNRRGSIAHWRVSGQ